ncbi:MAG: hypothetical protein ACM3X7_12385 [Solirubrobacterales bacterium]
MKKFKRLIILTLIPILLELAGFLFIDQFYLNDETVFNTKKVDAANKKLNNINVELPNGASNIGVSYNGNYISYTEDGKVTVVDTSNNKKKQIEIDRGCTFSICKWLPDRDIMLVSYKYIDSQRKGFIKFKSYNAKKDESTALSNEKSKELSIPLNDSNSDVQNITLSTATNVTYVQVGLKGTISKIYRINVMAQMEATKYVSCTLGNISVVNKEDKLVYEDRTNNRIRVVGMINPIATGENATHYLLGTDEDDMIYIGNGEDNKISKIFTTSITGAKSQLKTYNLSNAADIKDIYVSRSGKIYINDSTKSKLTEVISGKEVDYKGIFIKIFDNGIISNNNGKIISTHFN